MRTCEDGDGHSAILTYSRRWRDWFRIRYWVRCLDCDEAWGPYADEQEARDEARRRDFASKPLT
jgi:hypothetical protein